MIIIRDPIYVRRLERRLGRRLTDMELEPTDEGLELRFPNGHYEFHFIPLLAFPYDLLSAPECYVSGSNQNEE